MAVYRYVKEGKITGKKRSFCDFCGRQLRWYENIPVVSWVIQGGRSRCCGKRLDITYPIVELLVGILFVAVGFNLIGWLIAALLVFSAAVDAKYQILPDFSTIILVILALFFGSGNILVAGGAAGLLLGLNLITRGKGMGMGDVKLAVFMGLFLGWPKIIIAFYTAFISGAIVGLVLLVTKRAERKSTIAFGPFLIFGTGVAWYYGSRIWEKFGSLVLP